MKAYYMDRWGRSAKDLLAASKPLVIYHYLQLFVLILSLTLFTGCGSDSEPAPVLDEMTIESSNGNRLDIVTQQETVLSVSGKDQFGNAIDITSTVQWSADNSNVSIDQTGKVTPQTVGTSLITAQVDAVMATFSVSVWDSSAPVVEIYVSDVGTNRNGPHQILKYDGSGGSPEVFISTGVSRPQDIIFLEDQGVVLVSNLGSNNINKFNIQTGSLIGAFATGLAGPTRIDIGPDNLLYAIMWNGGRVKRYQLDGTFVDDFTSTSINQAIGMAWDSNGNYYVASFNNGQNGFVRKFDTSGNDMGLFIRSNLAGPTDIWFDASGNLFANDWAGNSVKKFDSNGNFVQTFIQNVTQPEGVAFLDDGSILIGASGTSSIKMYNSTGAPVGDLVRAGLGGLKTPNAVIVRKVE